MAAKGEEDSAEMDETPTRVVVDDGYLHTGDMEEDDDYGSAGSFCLGLSYFVACLFFPCVSCCLFKTVRQFERAIVLRFGKIWGGIRAPGLLCFLPCTDSIHTVDMRVKTYHVPSQEVLTGDSVSINMNAVVYYRISDPVKAYLNVENCEEATKLLAQSTLRSMVSSRDLLDLLVKRDSISVALQSIMDQATEPWGVTVTRVELRDIVLPHNLQRAMAAEAEASRVAKGKIIAADGEAKAAANLATASTIMAQSPGAMQLRYLQTLTTIGAEQNTTIVFPFPMELFDGIRAIGSLAGRAQPQPSTMQPNVAAGTNLFPLSDPQPDGNLVRNENEEDSEESEEERKQPLPKKGKLKTETEEKGALLKKEKKKKNKKTTSSSDG